jgi:hypothetical protein
MGGLRTDVVVMRTMEDRKQRGGLERKMVEADALREPQMARCFSKKPDAGVPTPP